MPTAPPASRPDVELLAVPARPRRPGWRRWLGRWVGLALALVATAAAVGTAHQHHHRISPPATATPPKRAADPQPAAHALDRPATLAVGRGLLFVADDTRNMIFARHPDGHFSVVAGTGRNGFSGDGGPAVRARLDDPAGMTYDTATRTLYVADSGNNRVRAINARGIIHTVIGGGRHHGDWVRSGTAAAHADFERPDAVALSPVGELFATNGLEVVRLERDGDLVHVAGVRTGPGGITGVGGPATHATLDEADGLAFDGHGDLFLAGENTKAMLEITPNGTMHDRCPDCLYPRGNAGLTTAPDGSVLAMAPTTIYRYDGRRRPHSIVDLGRVGPVDGITGVSAAGIAVTDHGVIYIDTDDRDGYTDATAILAIPPGRRPQVIWRRS